LDFTELGIHAAAVKNDCLHAEGVKLNSTLSGSVESMQGLIGGVATGY